MGADFTKNQLSEVAIQREYGWGPHVINRTCYSQWIALACRLGMTEATAGITKTLRSWCEQNGPVPSVNRGGYRESDPVASTSRGTHQTALGTVRGRVRTRDDDDDDYTRGRSTSRNRRSSLNRGSSGRYQGHKRSRFD